MSLLSAMELMVALSADGFRMSPMTLTEELATATADLRAAAARVEFLLAAIALRGLREGAHRDAGQGFNLDGLVQRRAALAAEDHRHRGAGNV